MKILVCPLNGPRPVSEFAYGGEVRVSPDPNTCTDAEWSAYVFNRSGSPGVKYEWWCHIASGFWFVALRDTALDLAPINAEEAARLLRKLKGAALLDGFRGAPAVDIAPLADILVRVSEFASDQQLHIAELDINPIICGHIAAR